MDKVRLYFLCVSIFICSLAGGQDKQYSFVHYGVNNGLAAYNARSIAQDENGFMWIGTINGLQRFDGSRFITFRHNPADTNSISDNYVDQLLFDKFQNLWLVLSDGTIGIFDTHRFVFRKAKIQLSNENNLQAVRRITQDNEGNVFYTFQNIELLTYNRRTNTFSSANNFFEIPASWRIVNLIQDPLTKKYWIGTDSGMAVYNPVSRKLSYYGHNLEQEPVIEKMGKIKGVGCYGIDKKRRLWFWSWPLNVGASRLYCYDLKNNTLVFNEVDLVPVIKKYIEPDYFMEQKDGSIWISGLNIFAKYLEKENAFQPISNVYSNEQSIYYERAVLFEDREQNVWVATTNNGVYVFNPSQQLFTSIKHINRLTGGQGGGYLLSFEPAAGNTMLVGVWGDGIYRYDSNFNNIQLRIDGIPEANNLPVWDFCRMKRTGLLWIVGQPGFIYLYDEKNNVAKRYDPPIFQSRTIRQVVEDRLGNVWLGTQNLGLVKWKPSKATKNFEDGFYKVGNIADIRVKKILMDSKGFIWICTNKEGVYKIDPANDKILDHLTKNNNNVARLLTNDASAILEYDDTTMIIATGGLNIYNTKNKSVRYITSENGLPSDAVATIEKDKSGYLWFGLINGLCRMNLEKNSFTFFDRSDGIANDNFMIAASHYMPGGRMLFGSSDDFVMFNPDNIKTVIPPPDATITDIKLMNKSLSVDSLMKGKRMELSADQNSLSIGFAGLSYLNKSKPVFYYMMEGIEKEWRKANVLNQAVYNYLPAGNYIFKIKTENADGIVGKKITELLIKIKPPFWKTWWFLSLFAFAFIGIIYWLDKFRVARIRDTERVRTRIATSLTKDMSSTLSSINVLSELAKVKADKDIERTKDYINQISENSNRMMEVMDDMIWSINPQNDELQYTIIRMKKYASQIEAAYSLEVSFNVDGTVNEIKLDMDRRHEFFLIYKEALLNAGRHAAGKFVDVDISCENAKLKMQVVDNGKGYDLNANAISFGRGLNEMRKKAAMLHASLEVKSEINTGTSVLLIMPL